MSRPDTNIVGTCSIMVTKAYDDEEQDSLKLRVVSDSPNFDTRATHTFRCVQDVVREDNLAYNWQVIDIYKSAPMQSNQFWTSTVGDTFTIGGNTLKYDRSFIVKCSA